LNVLAAKVGGQQICNV